MRRRGLGLCLVSLRSAAAIGPTPVWMKLTSARRSPLCPVPRAEHRTGHPNVTATTPQSSPGPSPLLTAQTRGDRAELRMIDRGPGLREAGAAVTILIGKLAA